MHDCYLKGRSFRPRGFVLPMLAALTFALALLAGCDSGASGKAEYVYVGVPEAALRDRVAPVFNKTGAVHNGERLLVLDRMQNRRFVRVRAPHGEEGWLQERYLIGQQSFDQFQRLAEQFKNTAPQGSATVEQQVRMHVLPGRKTDSMYMLDEKQKVAVLERRPVDRNAPAAAAPSRDEKSKDPEDASEDEAPPAGNQPAIWEDWWLVRDAQQHVGWVLGRMLYMDVPDDVAQYAEGQRIIAAFPLDQVDDGGKKVNEYLALFTEPKDGMPYDFNQIRIFTWNTRKHRYETAYRERLSGTLPVVLGNQEFEKEGTLRTFTVRLKDADGSFREQTYKFKPPMVHKVYVAGQEPPAKTRSKGVRPRSTT